MRNFTNDTILCGLGVVTRYGVLRLVLKNSDRVRVATFKETEDYLKAQDIRR